MLPHSLLTTQPLPKPFHTLLPTNYRPSQPSHLGLGGVVGAVCARAALAELLGGKKKVGVKP